MGCFKTTIKIFLIVENVLLSLSALTLIFVTSLAIAAIGTVQAQSKEQSGLNEDQEAALAILELVKVFAIVGVILGALLFAIAILGCCGACKEHPRMLRIYSSILLTLFILEVALAIFAPAPKISTSNTGNQSEATESSGSTALAIGIVSRVLEVLAIVCGFLLAHLISKSKENRGKHGIQLSHA